MQINDEIKYRIKSDISLSYQYNILYEYVDNINNYNSDYDNPEKIKDRRYAYSYIFNYKSYDDVNEHIIKLINFFDKNLILFQKNLELQKKYYRLIKDKENKAYDTKINEQERKKNMEYVNGYKMKLVNFIINYKQIYSIFFINKYQQHLQHKINNKDELIRSNRIWTDIALSIMLNIFQIKIFTLLISVLENDEYLDSIINFLRPIYNILDCISRKMENSRVERREYENEIYNIKQKQNSEAIINELKILIKENFKTEFYNYDIDISEYYYYNARIPQNDEIKDEIILQITDEFINYFVRSDLEKDKKGAYEKTLLRLIINFNEIKAINQRPVVEEPVEQVVQQPVQIQIEQPQQVKKQSLMNRATTAMSTAVSKVASKIPSMPSMPSIPSMPSFNWKKSKTGGESKQSRKIIKTKERVVVRYENVKYKRNVLIKNNKRYVKINKRLVAI